MRSRWPGSRRPPAFGGSSSPSTVPLPAAAGLAAVGARGRVAPALGEQGELHGRQRLELPDDAVPAVVAPRAARAAGDRVARDPQRELELERLHRGVERVRHRDVHRARAVGVRAGALPAAERLVVGEALAAQREVVHRPLAECPSEGGEDEVGDPRGGLDVARHHGGRRAGVEQRSLRRADLDRPVGAGGRRDVGIRQDADREVGRRARDGERAVEVALVLERRAREVQDELLAADRRPQLEVEVALAGLEDVGRACASPSGSAPMHARMRRSA